MEYQGKCLCGKTEVDVSGLKNTVIACHCGMCRKQAAGPIFYSDAVKKNNYSFSEASAVKIFASSDWAERAFCQECGTFLFTRYLKNGNTHFNIELFDGIEALDFKLQIHTKDKAAYYDFDNKTRMV
ncbi:GFA family protein [Amphibacillus sp. Q70]|uniref:GFA family protein n=1 Tax=Amphibacillus sp. Q70 TaxID=3453416 RepID=UPI003F8726F3